MDMKRWQCVKKCCAGEFLWEVGMVFDGEEVPLTRKSDMENIKEEFFKEIEGFTPHGGGMYTERQAILLELEVLKARFNRTWPVERLRTLLEEYKEAALQTKREILADAAVEVGIQPTEGEALERVEKRIEEKRKEDAYTADADRVTLMAELKKREIKHSKYQSTEILRGKLKEALGVEYAIDNMQSSPD